MNQLNAHRRLNRQDFKTLTLSALGGALEFYDFVIFVFFAATIGQLFFPHDMPEWLKQFQTFGIFAAGYLARPLGGVIMAHFGDLLGRKRMFTLSIFLMAVPTLLIGALPTYQTIGVWAPLALLLLRILQGAAIGGEVPGAWVFVAEHVPRRHIGLATGSLTAGLTAGILLGSLVAGLLNRTFSSDELQNWAWRLPFILGGIFGLLAMVLRQWLEETPVFLELQKRKALSQGMPIMAVFRGHWVGLTVNALLTWVLSAAIVVVILMTPTFLQKQYGFSATAALTANSWAIVALTCGCVFFGQLADKIGAGLTTTIGSVLLFFSAYGFYSHLVSDPEHLVYWYVSVGFCVGVVGSFALTMVRVFPAPIRFTGLSFSYNLSYAIFGGLTPLLVAGAMKTEPMMPMYYVMAMAVLGVAVGLFILFYQRHLFNTDD